MYSATAEQNIKKRLNNAFEHIRVKRPYEIRQNIRVMKSDKILNKMLREFFEEYTSLQLGVQIRLVHYTRTCYVIMICSVHIYLFCN